MKTGIVTINGETYIMIPDKEDKLSEEGYLVRVGDKEVTHELSDIRDVDLEIVNGKVVIAKCRYTVWG